MVKISQYLVVEIVEYFNPFSTKIYFLDYFCHGHQHFYTCLLEDMFFFLLHVNNNSFSDVSYVDFVGIMKPGVDDLIS